MLNTVLKAGQVLRLFDNRSPEWGVSEVAGKLAIPKSSAHALLSSLTEIGVLQRATNGRYRLGWRLFALGRIMLETAEFRAKARTVMEELVRQYHETVQLGVLEHNIVVYLDRLEGTHAVRADLTGLGAANYAHCTAIGKALLAGLPRAEVKKILGQYGMPRMTAHTITDLAQLEGELDQARRQGYAYNFEEAHEDLWGVGAPILDYTGTVIAAISMAAPKSRFQRYDREYREAVVRACKAVSRELGYLPTTTRASVSRRGNNR
jgi:DNA-binding IclR family transcriptional regulator